MFSVGMHSHEQGKNSPNFICSARLQSFVHTLQTSGSDGHESLADQSQALRMKTLVKRYSYSIP